jgi:branched-chain amino acid transport system ATP-binding protein
MALKVAQRGYVIESGRCVLEGSSEELRESNIVREVYLGSSA